MMKNIKFIYSKITLLLAFIFMVTVSCERDLSENVEFSTFSETGEIFMDNFTGGLDYFPYENAYLKAFSVDVDTKYKGSASMRFDVPNESDPLGAYAGAIFRLDSPRDLTGFDALTFWAKSSENRAIDQIGFGQDFGEDKYQASVSGLQLTTNWRKYVIPIPDASKLFSETGMFWFSEGDETGYTFWIDELQFEKLGTLGTPRPEIAEGEDTTRQSFIGTSAPLGGSTVTFNLPSGFDVIVRANPSYFDWTSSDPSVVAIEDFGNIAVIANGTSVITATLAGVQAVGSLTIEVLGVFEPAPIPPVRNPDNVISVFSNAYNNVPVDYYNGYFAPFQTTLGEADIFIDGDRVISYTNLNFVAIGMFKDVASVNATNMTHIHVDINIREAIQSGDFIKLELLNNVGGLETSGSFTIDRSQLLSKEWVSLDIPLDDFLGLTVRNQLGLIFFISDATISNIYVDNVYFYKE